ncbi:MAG: MarR family winged helix-turn-helix transcriptional regulator [Candidatus Kapabacteria bacterium]|jgi:DNA-binding MarR family transcriptional regulator|nr:MarR family winged helix-turn-helix transcriptional regulator [Candidatus Kapabacteria bacterium]
MNIEEIILLLQKWSEFKTGDSNGSIDEFGLWLLQDSREKINIKQVSIIKRNETNADDEYSYDMQFLASYFLTRIGKFIKLYSKNIYTDYGLSGSDDFSFLALIDKMDNPNKKEICTANITELTTGYDIIRKLLKMKYIIEVQDNNDKRAKKISITQAGRDVVSIIYNRMRRIQEDILGDLSNEERVIMIRFLERLNTYHTNLVYSK